VERWGTDTALDGVHFFRVAWHRVDSQHGTGQVHAWCLDEGIERLTGLCTGFLVQDRIRIDTSLLPSAGEPG
jgi:hypothetical protein